MWHAVTSAIIFKALHHLDIFRVTAASELEGLDLVKHDEPAYAFGISMFSVIVSTLTQLIYDAQNRRTLAHRVAFYQLGTIFKKFPTLDFFADICQNQNLSNHYNKPANTCFYSMKFFQNRNQKNTLSRIVSGTNRYCLAAG